MGLPREPFSWEGGEDDQPIPLGDGASTTSGSGQLAETAVVAAAESHVREAQDALAREDTDPYLDPTLAAGAPVASAIIPSTFRRGLRASLIAVLCVAAFAHGWSRGSAQAAPSCERTHCATEYVPAGSTKEQVR